MKIQGIAGMTVDQLNFELKRGGRFVIFPYCVSLLLVTLRRPSPIYSLRGGESSIIKGLTFTLLSLVAGWGAFPGDPSTRCSRSLPTCSVAGASLRK